MVDQKLRYQYELVTNDEFSSENGVLTVPYIYRIIQDAAAHQLYKFYDSLEYLQSIGKAYVILRMNIKTYNELHPNESVMISTWERSKGPVKMFRNYVVENSDGEKVADASSLWTFLDLSTRRPISTKNIPNPVLNYEEDVGADSSIKLIRDENGEQVGKKVVLESDIDLFGHMNNVKYVDLTFAHIPNDIRVKEFTIEFISECKLGDELDIKLSVCDGVYKISGVKADGTLSFLSEIKAEV